MKFDDYCERVRATKSCPQKFSPQKNTSAKCRALMPSLARACQAVSCQPSPVIPEEEGHCRRRHEDADANACWHFACIGDDDMHMKFMQMHGICMKIVLFHSHTHTSNTRAHSRTVTQSVSARACHCLVLKQKLLIPRVDPVEASRGDVLRCDAMRCDFDIA